MIIINNQPVNFQTDPFENPYVDEIKYKQLVQQGDITQFQFQTNADFNGQNVLLNPNFQLSLADWYFRSVNQLFTWNDGVLYYEQTGTKYATSLAQQTLIPGNKYEINIKINHSQNGVFRVYLGTNLIATKTVGTHKISGVCEGTNELILEFVPNVSAGGGATRTVAIGSIDYIYCAEKQTNNHRFQIIDTEDNTVVQTLNAVNSYLTDPFSESSFAQFIDSSLTMSIDWQTLSIPNGCYKIGVCDADINTSMQCGALNPELTGGEIGYLPNWFLNTTGTGSVTTNDPVASNWGRVLLRAGTSGDTALIYQETMLAGVDYEFAVNILTISGTNATLNVQIGGTANNYTTTGIKTGTSTAFGSNLQIEFTADSAGFVIIDYVRVQATASTLVPDYYSNPFNLATTHHRTIVVNCNNSENIFGLNYETVLWTPRARLRGYLAPSDNPYQTTRKTAETLRGRRDVYYYKRRKSMLLVVENEPEFMHDWLSMLEGHDHAMINNKEYFIDDDEYPSISWDYFRVLGSIQLPVSLKQQLEIKTIKGEFKTPQFIEDADGDGIVGGTLNVGGDLFTGNEYSVLTSPTRDGVVLATPISTTYVGGIG